MYNTQIYDNKLYSTCRCNIYQDGRDRIPLTCLTPPQMRACPRPGPGFPTSYVVISPFFVFGEMRLEVIVRIVDNWWNCCLNFLFVTDLYLKESMFYIEIWHLICFNLKVSVLYMEAFDKIFNLLKEVSIQFGRRHNL
jgi:hypothetical protein